MSVPSFVRTARGLLVGGLYLLLAAVVLFFGLTRTRVGRDVVRQQIEAQFNEQFRGTLRIGALEGNLVWDLFARDVLLLSATGDTIAHVDSVVARPSWRSMWRGYATLRSLTLIRPHLWLHQRADSTWTIARALGLRTAAPSNGPPSFALGDVEIVDGTVRTTSAAPPPAIVRNGWLFDYTTAELRGLNAQMHVQWLPKARRVDVDALRFALSDQRAAVRMTGTVRRTGGAWHLDAARLQSGGTDLAVEARWRPADAVGQRRLMVDVAPSTVNNTAWQRLVPRWPLARSMQVAGRVHGPLRGLVIDSLMVAHGLSRASVRGTLVGWPDSLDAELAVRHTTVRPSDVDALVPGAPLAALHRTGPLRLSAYVRSTVHGLSSAATPVALQGTADWSVAGAPGRAGGTARLRYAASDTLAFQAALTTQQLAVHRVVRRVQRPVRLSGVVTLSGEGRSLQALRTATQVRLSDAQLGPQRLDSLALDASAVRTAAGRRVEGTLQLRQPAGGRLTAQGAWVDSVAVPRVALEATAERFELQPVMGGPPTQLTATLTAQASGLQRWAALQGTADVSVAQAIIARSDSITTLPAHRVTVALKPRSATGSRVRIGGDVVAATLAGDVAVEPLWALGRLWAAETRAAVTTLWSKPRRPAAPDSLVTASAQPSPPSTSAARTVPAAQQAVARVMRAADYARPLEVASTLRWKRPAIVRAWWPAAPAVDSTFTATMAAVVSPDSLQLRGTLTAERLGVGSWRGHDPAVQFRLGGTLRERPLHETLSVRVEARADRLANSRVALQAATASFDFKNQRGTLAAQAQRAAAEGWFNLRATVQAHAAYNTLTLRELSLAVPPVAWEVRGTPTVRLYRDAVQMDRLTFQSTQPAAARVQRLQLDGTFSPYPTDTLAVEASNVRLLPFSQVAQMNHPLGGSLSGRTALTGGWRAPELSGSFAVQRLSLDQNLLGRLTVSSQYALDRQAVRLNARLAPADTTVDVPILVPGGLTDTRRSTLSMVGTVGLGTAGRTPLNLSVNIAEADLFFFKYIFEDDLGTVDGYVAGTGRIGGYLTDPLFEADLRVANGYATVPEFGLAYNVSGPVRVDARGIHLQDVTVRDQGEGRATMNGSVLFNDYEFFSFNLRGDLQEMQFINVAESQTLPFYGDIRASGTVRLVGPLSSARLYSSRVRTTPNSRLVIPVIEGGVSEDSGFIIFADSTGQLPDLREINRRDNVLADRPEGEPTFLDGLDINLNIVAPEGSQVDLAFDPVVGDVVRTTGSGRVQLQRTEGTFYVYGSFDVQGGSYLFTAGEVFVRQFAIDGGTITWTGDPINAQLNLNASYRTRAAPAGLPGYDSRSARIPVIVELFITGTVEVPRVDLGLAIDRDQPAQLVGTRTLDAILNQPELTTEYATSVLLTNTFLLTTTSAGDTGAGGNRLASAGNQLAFNSVSQLVASQLNRYLSKALPNVDLNVGIQGENPQNLDIIYGVALRLLNERLIIRGEGVYTADEEEQTQTRGPQGEFVVEVRLSRRVSAEVFYRRTGDTFTRGRTLTTSAGARLSYQTEFPTWKRLLYRVFGWLLPDRTAARGTTSDDTTADGASTSPDSTAAPPASEGTATGAAADSSNRR